MGRVIHEGQFRRLCRSAVAAAAAAAMLVLVTHLVDAHRYLSCSALRESWLLHGNESPLMYQPGVHQKVSCLQNKQAVCRRGDQCWRAVPLINPVASHTHK